MFLWKKGSAGSAYRLSVAEAKMVSSSQRHALTVEEYSRQFVRQITEDDERFSDDDELTRTASTMHSLLLRLAQDGDREDVRVPFKILKDEFGNAWREASMARRDGIVHRLFRILDVVHASCVKALVSEFTSAEALSPTMSSGSPSTSSACSTAFFCATSNGVILEELRLRVSKMVAGDTWDGILPMRLAALKRMHKYNSRELEACGFGEAARGGSPLKGCKKLTNSKFVRAVTGGSPAMCTWAAAFDELFSKPGNKLAPLLTALLEENARLADELESERFRAGKNAAAAAAAAISSPQSNGKAISPFTPKGPPIPMGPLGPLTTRLSLHAGNLIDLEEAVMEAERESVDRTREGPEGPSRLGHNQMRQLQQQQRMKDHMQGEVERETQMNGHKSLEKEQDGRQQQQQQQLRVKVQKQQKDVQNNDYAQLMSPSQYEQLQMLRQSVDCAIRAAVGPLTPMRESEGRPGAPSEESESSKWVRFGEGVGDDYPGDWTPRPGMGVNKSASSESLQKDGKTDSDMDAKLKTFPIPASSAKTSPSSTENFKLKLPPNTSPARHLKAADSLSAELGGSQGVGGPPRKAMSMRNFGRSPGRLQTMGSKDPKVKHGQVKL